MTLFLLLAVGQIALMALGTWYLVWLADRHGLTRTHALWGLLGMPGVLLGAAGIAWIARK